MEIRRTTPADKEEVLALYEAARRFMAENGNPNQWVNGYPGADQLEADMAAGGSYVCVREGKIVGTFYFASATEPNYHRITGGNWLNDRPYGVVHRITSAPGTHGVASFCLAWCFASAAISASIPIGTIFPCRKRWKKTATGSAVRSIWRTARADRLSKRSVKSTVRFQ